MLFAIQKNDKSTWSVTPTSGVHEGVAVAEVDGINLKRVKVVGKTLIGTIKAVWGCTILCEDVYDDHETLRSLALGGCFDMSPEEPLRFDFDGLYDTANRQVRTARAVVAIGPNIYAEGAT